MRKALVGAAMIAASALFGGSEPDMIDLLKKEISAHPLDTHLTVQLVEMLIDRERFPEATDSIQSALGKNGQVSDLHQVNGDLLYREGRVPEAAAEYDAALQLDPRNALAIYGKARTLAASGYRAKAADLVRAAYALSPDDDEIGRAFDALDRSSASSIARWEKDLRDPHLEARRRRYLETNIAGAKIMHGRQAWELASPSQHYELPYRLVTERRRPIGLGVSVSVNGVNTILRLDTGAPGVSVSSGFAAKAGIQKIGSSTEWGFGSNGSVNTWVGYAEELRIGDVAFKNIIVNVKEKGWVDESGGLLGTDIFNRFLVKVNFAKHAVDLDPLFGPAWDGITPVDPFDGPELKGFAPMLQVRHYLLLPTVVSENEKSNHATGLFLLDTGAGFNSISTDLARSVTTVGKNHHMSVNGVSGKVKMLYEAQRITLQFAGFQQPIPDLAAFDLSDISRSAGLEVGGILGMPLLQGFQSFTIDYRDEKINFDLTAQ